MTASLSRSPVGSLRIASSISATERTRRSLTIQTQSPGCNSVVPRKGLSSAIRSITTPRPRASSKTPQSVQADAPAMTAKAIHVTSRRVRGIDCAK
jgi:hypothetical protein